MQSVKDAHSNLPTFYKQMWPLGMCILHSIAGWYIGSSSILVYIPCNMHFFKYRRTSAQLKQFLHLFNGHEDRNIVREPLLTADHHQHCSPLNHLFPLMHTLHGHICIFSFFIVSSHLCQKNAEIFERLQQTGVSDFLYNKDTFGWLVPCQPLTGWILYMPE